MLFKESIAAQGNLGAREVHWDRDCSASTKAGEPLDPHGCQERRGKSSESERNGEGDREA